MNPLSSDIGFTQEVRRLILGLTLLLLTGLLASCGATPQHSEVAIPVPSVLPSPPKAILGVTMLPITPNSTLQFETASVGWRVVGQGASQPSSVPASASLGLTWPGYQVERTDDGGVSWTSSLIDPSGIWGLDFVSPNTGWIVGVNSLFSTMNGGQTWQVGGEPHPHLVAVDFVDQTTGYGITATGTLDVSTDAGSTWHSSSFPHPVSSVCFSNPDMGYIASQRGGFIEATSNGGATWALSYGLPIAMTPDETVDTDLACSQSAVWALEDFGNTFGAATRSSYAVARTLNGGASWTMVGNNITGGSPALTTAAIPVALPTSMIVAGAKSATIVGLEASNAQVVVATTSNGGLSFHAVTLALTEGVHSGTASAPDQLSVQGIAEVGPSEEWLLIGEEAAPAGTYKAMLLASADTWAHWTLVSDQTQAVVGQ